MTDMSSWAMKCAEFYIAFRLSSRRPPSKEVKTWGESVGPDGDLNSGINGGIIFFRHRATCTVDSVRDPVEDLLPLKC
jgi:hypothetical protein